MRPLSLVVVIFSSVLEPQPGMQFDIGELYPRCVLDL